MKNLILTLAFFLVSFTVFGQTTKIFIKSFPYTTNNVNVDIEGIKEIKYWDGNTIKIELTVTASVPNETMYSLVKIGRYDMEYKFENNTSTISLPKLKTIINIGGVKINETVKLIIWIPDLGQNKQNISM
jgi:hypothetical protein